MHIFISLFLSLFISIFFFFSSTAYAREIRYPNLSGMGNTSIGYAVLDLALSKVDKNHQLMIHQRESNPSRILYMLENKQIDVIDGGYFPAVAEKFDLIYLPIDLGISGWRVCITHKDTVDKLKQVKSIEDLKGFTFGQGVEWYDTLILKHAGFTVLTTPKLGNLINMLKAKRFDLLPLGANEVYKLMEFLGHKNDSDVVVDDSITIIYPFGRFFYVRKEERELKHMIQTGMEKALSDGSLFTLLKSHPFFRDVIERAKLKERVQIHIETPNQTEGFKSIDPKWWYQP